jgi:hypothetical protein
MNDCNGLQDCGRFSSRSGRFDMNAPRMWLRLKEERFVRIMAGKPGYSGVTAD